MMGYEVKPGKETAHAFFKGRPNPSLNVIEPE